ncbi:MAG: CotH kinase family protein, partial [Flavobacteriales bacterium]
MRHFPTKPALFLVASLCCISTSAQNLPQMINISPDGRMLTTGDQASSGFYAEDTVKAVQLTFLQSNYWTLLENNYASQTPIPALLSYDGLSYTDVGVRFKGETSYFMLPPGSEKMSFDVDMNQYSAQDIDGYESLNFNNSFQDNSFMREVVFCHLIRRHVPAAKANYIKLSINGENWGLYPNVQGLSSEFLAEWYYSNNGDRWRAARPDGQGMGQWGDGTAALNYLGPDTTDYQTYYTLQNSHTTNPWTNLVNACDALNNTPSAQLYDSLKQYMNVDRVLWNLAVETAFSDDDSYIHKGKNDYSLYFEPESGLLTTHEIDGNSVLSTNNLNWSAFYHETDANYPLMNKLYAVPQLRQRYLAHLRTVIADCMDQTTVSQVISDFQTMVDTIVQNDPKKLMTYAQFTAGTTGLLNNFNTRRNNLNNNSEVAQAGPVVGTVDHEVGAGLNTDPDANEAVDVRATVTSTNGVYAVALYWSPALYGNFQKATMFDDGAHNDGSSGDGVYGAQIPPHSGGVFVRYYIEAAANNTAHTVSYAPPGAEHDVYFYQHLFPQAVPTGVVINEVMADNAMTAQDENSQYEDWIELHNNTGTQVDMSLWFISDSPYEPYKWRMPVGTSIPANGYLIIWADEDEGQGDLHTNYKLSDSGEQVLLFTDDSLLVDQTQWTDLSEDMGWARIPNGTGPFVMQGPTFATNNESVGVQEVGGGALIALSPNPTAGMFTVVALGGSQA